MTKCLLLCLLPAVVFSLNYQDPLTRSKFFAATSAAYSDTPAKCLASQFPNATLKRRVSVLCDMADACSGYTAVSLSDKAIIIAYRGTSTNFQFIEDVWGTLYEKHVNWMAGGWVAHYFYNGFSLLWTKGMKDDFLTLLNQYPDFGIWITGHSLGATFAVLTASYLSYTNTIDKYRINLITFGEPRIGEYQFAASINNDVPNAVRVVHAADAVARLPSVDKHGGFYHHFTEVWYPEEMSDRANYTVCSDAAESPNCSDSLKKKSFDDHMWYFEKEIESYGKNNCVCTKKICN